MFQKEDTTFFELREKSVQQWLLEMEGQEDLVVRSGVKVTCEYIEALKRKIQRLEEENALKDSYLKKVGKNRRTQ